MTFWNIETKLDKICNIVLWQEIFAFRNLTQLDLVMTVPQSYVKMNIAIEFYVLNDPEDVCTGLAPF